MPKAPLASSLAKLEMDIVETLLAGHKQWRPDLAYPQSHSDMQGAVRGLLQMYHVVRLPLPCKLEYVCDDCQGLGKFVRDINNSVQCMMCNGSGTIHK